MAKKRGDNDKPETRGAGRVAPASNPTAQSGPVIRGDVSGDVVGGNMTVTQTAGGDIVGRDKITTTTAPAPQLAEQFQQIRQQIAARPEDPKVDKEEIQDTVKRIEAEAAKGEAANADKVERWLMNLGAMADDIFQVVAATLASPALGIAKTIQLIARRAKDEKKKQEAGGQAAP